MKTKEIIEQAQIQDGLTARKQPTLFKLMIEELRNTYDEFGVDDSEQHFNASVKIVKSKWDSVSQKIKIPFSDGLWGYFFATEVIKVKHELCPTWSIMDKKRKDEYEIRRRKREQKKMQRADENWIDDLY